MKITYKNYVIVAGDDTSTANLYDLWETKEVKEKVDKKPTGRLIEKEVFVGYSFTLERAIQRIIAAEVNKGADVLPLQDYIKGLKKEREILHKLLKT